MTNPTSGGGGVSLDDRTLAAQAARDHGDRLRFCQDEGVWYVRSRDTGVWTVEYGGASKAAAEATIADAGVPVSATKVRNVLDLMKHRLWVRPEDFDADPMLLAVGNGVLDLEKGEMRALRPELLLTRRAPVPYVPDAAENFERLVLGMVDGSQAVAAFLRRAAGYSLTGSIDEECVFIPHGETQSGKSTLRDGLSAALGSYARAVQPSAFLQRKDATTRYTPATLKGRRLVTTTETRKGDWLDEALVKQMTSDTIEARHPAGRPFEYRPQFKVWIFTNHLPRGIGDDPALRRRVYPIHFPLTFDPDPKLKAWVRSEEGATAALAWMVRGCREWREEGLQPPEVLLRARERQAEEEDTFGQFLQDEFDVVPTEKVPTGAAYARYQDWCQRHGERPMTSTAFGIAMRERKHGSVGTGRNRHYPGLRLVPPPNLAELRDRVLGS